MTSAFRWWATLAWLCVLGLSGVAVADAGNNAGFFIGLWQGIDTEDGSRLLLSVDDIDRDGTLTVRLSDTFFSGCVAAGYSGSPGLADGPATAQRTTLSWKFSLKCYDPGFNGLVEIRTGDFAFEAHRNNRTLVAQDGVVFHPIGRP